RFAIRHVERSSVRFYKAGDKKQKERRGAPRREDKPTRHDSERIFTLRSNNRVRHERTDRHHYRQHGDNQRQFITEHLRDRTHGAEHGKLVIARPPGHEHCKFRCRPYGEKKEYAAVYREGRHISAIW